MRPNRQMWQAIWKAKTRAAGGFPDTMGEVQVEEQSLVGREQELTALAALIGDAVTGSRLRSRGCPAQCCDGNDQQG